MNKLDLDRLSRDELLELRKDVDKALKDYDTRRKKEATAILEAKAKEMGFTLAELTGTLKRRRSAPPAKFRHPENAELTWSGRGRQPRWIKEALDEGQSLDDLRIAA